MLNIYYVKTPHARAAINASEPSLTPRERQILLLCSGQRPLSVLIELFGESVVRELHELVVRGFVQAMRRNPEEAPPRAADARGPAAAPEHPAAPQAQTRLRQTRDFATIVAQSLPVPDAGALIARHGQATRADDVLAYCVGVIDLLFRQGDLTRAERVGYKMADLLPRGLVPDFIDGMLAGPDPRLAAALYEHLLSDRELPAPDDDTPTR